MGKPLHRRVVPETYVQLLFEYVERHGLSPEAVLGESWPDPDPQGIAGVAVEHWDALLEAAERHFSDPLLGLHLGQTITARHLGILGPVLLASENFGAALERFERYQRLIFDVIPVSKRIGLGWVELTWDTQDYPSSRLVSETGITVMTEFSRNLTRGPIVMMAVHFTHAEPGEVKPYEEYFGCPVLFNQPEPLLRFGSEVLAMPLKSPDPALLTVLDRHANELLCQLPQEAEIIERLRKEIVRQLRHGEPNVQQLSASFCCSPRTLQRRLAEAGSNFRRELMVVRLELARSYLQDLRLQISEIALLLGYSEHSAFTRAYREWTGRTPQQDRETLSGKQDRAI